MPEKLCANCETVSSTASNVCSNCGAAEFRDSTVRLTDNTEPAPRSAMRIKTSRVIVASFLSAGLYFPYWYYLTWKQISTEIEGANYPFWHAVTMSVPVYGSFRMHAHVRVINELAARHNVKPAISPVLAAVLLTLAIILSFASLVITSQAAAIVLILVNTILSTIPMAMAQGVLNSYWEKAPPPDALSNMRIGVGEVVIVVIGFIFWIVSLIPRSLYE
jgi:hypothetical protein